eukprot:360663-Chlamydomonas_euryale.AAC.8
MSRGSSVMQLSCAEHACIPPAQLSVSFVMRSSCGRSPLTAPSLCQSHAVVSCPSIYLSRASGHPRLPGNKSTDV